MTRETRIGLLVGLLFIVAFGLVLSELTGKSPSAAPSSADASTVAVDAPRPFIWSPPAPEWRGAPAQPTTPLAAIAQSETVTPLGAQQQPVSQGVAQMSMSRMPEPTPLSTVAINGAASAPVAPAAANANQQNAGALFALVPPAHGQPATQPQGKSYKVEQGDTLLKIARKNYGPTYEREYKRILDANRDKLKDEKSLQVGMELTIPPLPNATPARPSAASEREVHVADASNLADALRSQAGLAVKTPTTAPATANATAKRTTYKVKKGDSLFKIARETLDSASKTNIDKIVSANRDKIHDAKDLKAGMELTIPL